MTSYFDQLNDELSEYLILLRKELACPLEHFNNFSLETLKDGALTSKTKELMALAISISKQNTSCISYHMKSLINLGLTRTELMELLSVTIYMNGGPAVVYAAEALKAFEQIEE